MATWGAYFKSYVQRESESLDAAQAAHSTPDPAFPKPIPPWEIIVPRNEPEKEAPKKLYNASIAPLPTKKFFDGVNDEIPSQSDQSIRERSDSNAARVAKMFGNAATNSDSKDVTTDSQVALKKRVLHQAKPSKAIDDLEALEALLGNMSNLSLPASRAPAITTSDGKPRVTFSRALPISTTDTGKTPPAATIGRTLSSSTSISTSFSTSSTMTVDFSPDSTEAISLPVIVSDAQPSKLARSLGYSSASPPSIASGRGISAGGTLTKANSVPDQSHPLKQSFMPSPTDDEKAYLLAREAALAEELRLERLKAEEERRKRIEESLEYQRQSEMFMKEKEEMDAARRKFKEEEARFEAEARRFREEEEEMKKFIAEVNEARMKEEAEERAKRRRERGFGLSDGEDDNARGVQPGLDEIAMSPKQRNKDKARPDAQREDEARTQEEERRRQKLQEEERLNFEREQADRLRYEIEERLRLEREERDRQKYKELDRQRRQQEAQAQARLQADTERQRLKRQEAERIQKAEAEADRLRLEEEQQQQQLRQLRGEQDQAQKREDARLRAEIRQESQRQEQSLLPKEEEIQRRKQEKAAMQFRAAQERHKRFRLNGGPGQGVQQQQSQQRQQQKLSPPPRPMMQIQTQTRSQSALPSPPASDDDDVPLTKEQELRKAEEKIKAAFAGLAQERSQLRAQPHLPALPIGQQQQQQGRSSSSGKLRKGIKPLAAGAGTGRSASVDQTLGAERAGDFDEVRRSGVARSNTVGGGGGGSSRSTPASGVSRGQMGGVGVGVGVGGGVVRGNTVAGGARTGLPSGPRGGVMPPVVRGGVGVGLGMGMGLPGGVRGQRMI